MFAFGGGGGIPSAGIARAAGVPRVYFFPFGAQFCAFGSTCTDVLHGYSVVKRLELTNASDEPISEFNEAVDAMVEDAYFDMEGEGFDRGRVSFSLEAMIISERVPAPVGVHWSAMRLKSREDLKDLVDLYRARAAACGEHDRVFVKELRLKASCRLPDPEFPVHVPDGEDPRQALRSRRAAYWDGQVRDTPVYDQSLLKCGNVVKGMAFVESPHTTVLVPPGWKYRTDKYLNGILEAE
jgi:N-methylhydantoinase A/oxoprolinase/acetone carboxylase beta subunit